MSLVLEVGGGLVVAVGAVAWYIKHKKTVAKDVAAAKSVVATAKADVKAVDTTVKTDVATAKSDVQAVVTDVEKKV
jgi:hypothetical protein